jgi:tetratricopeptide (TPR) repeat protein
LKEEAVAMSDRLTKLLSMLVKNPRDPFLHYGVGMERKKLRQFDEAVAAFRAALEVDPAYSYAYYQIGQTLELAGDVPGARAAYQQGIAAADRAGDAHARGEIEAALQILQD